MQYCRSFLLISFSGIFVNFNNYTVLIFNTYLYLGSKQNISGRLGIIGSMFHHICTFKCIDRRLKIIQILHKFIYTLYKKIFCLKFFINRRIYVIILNNFKFKLFIIQFNITIYNSMRKRINQF